MNTFQAIRNSEIVCSVSWIRRVPCLGLHHRFTKGPHMIQVGPKKNEHGDNKHAHKQEATKNGRCQYRELRPYPLGQGNRNRMAGHRRKQRKCVGWQDNGQHRANRNVQMAQDKSCFNNATHYEVYRHCSCNGRWLLAPNRRGEQNGNGKSDRSQHHNRTPKFESAIGLNDHACQQCE